MIVRRIENWPTWDRSSPFEELERMRRQMDRLSEGITGHFLREPSAGVFPLVNTTEDHGNYYIRAELPGVKGDDLELSVTGNTLSIAGEREIVPQNEGAKYHRREREGGKFSRILSLPSGRYCQGRGPMQRWSFDDNYAKVGRGKAQTDYSKNRIIG